MNYKKGCTRLTVASDKVYQLFAHGQWFSPGSPASSTTKTSRHDIVEILLKVAINTIKSNQIKAKHNTNKQITYGCKWSAPFCNLQSRARTHAVLVIGLYELLGNPTT
jgi:hypothetical protein